mgnify:CR=1 FL=1
MTDQTRWGIPEVQLRNKIKMHQERNAMRVELKKFIEDCKVMDLQDMYMEMKRLKKSRKNNGVTLCLNLTL